jgi:uncharacterized membrane protein YGL010W
MPAVSGQYFFALLSHNKTNFMCNRNKSKLRLIPATLLSVLLICGGILKITGLHPMTPHFAEMGLSPYVEILGVAEIFIVVLYLIPRTAKLGLLLLTGYLGGAMAAEIPFHLMAAPAIPLTLAWIAAYVRNSSLFFEKPQQPIRTF